MDTNHWNNQKVLVTGCRGFIGGALARRLTSLHAHLILLIRPDSAPPDIFTNSQQAIVLNVSLSNVAALEKVMQEHKIKTVFHMAANNENRNTKCSPLAIFEDNIRATYSILEASRRSHVDRLILASSQEYDRQIHKTDAKMHPYGASKASIELVARSYLETYGLPVIVVKPDNVYGPGDQNFSRLIPRAVRHLLQGETFRPSGNPNTKRGFIYIEDFLDALLIIGNSSAQFNLSDFVTHLHADELHRIGDLLNLLETLIRNQDHTSKDSILMGRETAPRILKISDWKATVPIHEGLQHTIAYYKNQLSDT